MHSSKKMPPSIFIYFLQQHEKHFGNLIVARAHAPPHTHITVTEPFGEAYEALMPWYQPGHMAYSVITYILEYRVSLLELVSDTPRCTVSVCVSRLELDAPGMEKIPVWEDSSTSQNSRASASRHASRIPWYDIHLWSPTLRRMKTPCNVPCQNKSSVTDI